MGFFSSLSEVAKNRNNFSTWEANQRDDEARRKELYNRRKYTAEELESAKQLGERIVDVVDIMDNHSENVAENVETAVEPVVGLAPLIPTIPAALFYIKKIVNPGEKKLSELRRKHLYENENAINLAREITDDIHKTRPNKRGFDAYNFTSKRSIDKIKNSELKSRAMEIHKAYMKEAKPHLRKIKGGIFGVIGISIASFIAANIYAAKLQVDSSKIARYQARQLLEDERAFVNFTPEQIAAAKKYIEEHPELKKEKKKDKLKSGMLSSIINVLKDRKAYLQARKNDTDESKKVSRTLTRDELVRAKKDQEVIQRSVRIINNEAEKYSENMEVAAGIILGSTPIVGGAMGWLAGLLMNKTGLTDKIVSNIVKKEGSESAIEAYKRFKEIKPGDPGYSTRWGKFTQKLLDEVPDAKAADALSASAKKAPKHNYFSYIKKLFAAGMSHKWSNTKIIGLIGAIISSIPASLIALKLQKSSARAGRYTAKRELEKDPRNFIGYTEEDYNEVKDVNGKKQTFGQKVKEYALFIPTVIKQYYAYDKYKRTEFKEHQLLMDELKKADVSAEQLRDAKNLQRKLFNTFEKVDDNSQTYSESMEAAIEILQPFALSTGVLVLLSPLIYTGIQAGRGKISAATLLKKITDKLSKASNFLKSKTFKKYLDDVAKKIPHKVGNVELQNKPIASMLANIDFKNDTIGEVGTKIIKNIQASSGNFRSMSNFEQIKLIESIENSIKNTKAVFDIENPSINASIDSTLNLLKCLKGIAFDKQVRANMLDIFIKNTEAIRTMPERDFKFAMMKYADIICESIGEDKIRRFAQNLPQFAEDFPETADFINKFVKRHGENMTMFDLKAFKKAFVDIIDKKDYADISGQIDKFFSQNFSKEAFPYKLTDIPTAIDKMVEYANQSMKRNPHFDASRALEGKITTETGESALKGTISKFSNPIEYLKSFETKVKTMSDDEFYKMVDRIGISIMDKKTMLEILPKLEKILNNIPKDELKTIGKTLFEEFQKHPDEFIKALKSGNLATVFLTDSLIKTAAAAGISWAALNIALIWIIQTWLADIQLKAGRLGVMKAIESLEDPAYYADIEPDAPKDSTQNQSANPTPANTLAQSNTADTALQTGSLLKKFQK